MHHDKIVKTIVHAQILSSFFFYLSAGLATAFNTGYEVFKCDLEEV